MTGAQGSVLEQIEGRHVPMTGFTRPVPQGTTWVDCTARPGGAHTLVPAHGAYVRCLFCPVRFRSSEAGA